LNSSFKRRHLPGLSIRVVHRSLKNCDLAADTVSGFDQFFPIWVFFVRHMVPYGSVRRGNPGTLYAITGPVVVPKAARLRVNEARFV